MQTMTPVSEIISQAKLQAERMVAQMLYTFSFVPDDKLNWTPSPTSKSALRLVAHCAVSNHGISRPIRCEESSVEMPFEEVFRMMEEKEIAITSREQAIGALQESLVVVLSALDSVTKEGLNSSPESPFGPMPMMFWMFLPANHMMGHAYQIDYLQTIWGDCDFHFAPGD